MGGAASRERSQRWRRRHNDLSDTIHRCIGWRNSWEWFELYGYGMHILLGVAFAIRVRPGVGDVTFASWRQSDRGACRGRCVPAVISHRWRRRHNDLRDTIHRCIGWRNSWEWFELYGYGMHILLGVAFAIRVRPEIGRASFRDRVC